MSATTHDRSVPISAKMRSYVAFARFSINNNLTALETAELITLANKAFHAAERWCNTGSARDESANSRCKHRFEDKARSLGFSVSWPGLWPLLERNGVEVNLPSLD